MMGALERKDRVEGCKQTHSCSKSLDPSHSIQIVMGTVHESKILCAVFV